MAANNGVVLYLRGIRKPMRAQLDSCEQWGCFIPERHKEAIESPVDSREQRGCFIPERHQEANESAVG